MILDKNLSSREEHTFNSLDDVDRERVSSDIVCSTFIMAFHIGNNIKIRESPGMPGFIPRWIIVCRQKVSLQDVLDIPLEMSQRDNSQKRGQNIPSSNHPSVRLAIRPASDSNGQPVSIIRQFSVWTRQLSLVGHLSRAWHRRQGCQRIVEGS